MSEITPPPSTAGSDEQKTEELKSIVASQEPSIEDIKAYIKRVEEQSKSQLGEIQDQIQSLVTKKLSDRLQTQVSELEQAQNQLNDQAEVLGRLLHLAEQEANTPMGVIQDAARLVPDVELEGGPVVEKFNNVVTWIIRVFVLVLWSVLGFYFWVSILLRAFIAFSGQLIASTFANSSIAKAQATLNSAIGFYTSGFIQITRSFTKPLLDGVHKSLGFQETLWLLVKEFVLSTFTYALLIPFIRRWIIDVISSW